MPLMRTCKGKATGLAAPLPGQCSQLRLHLDVSTGIERCGLVVGVVDAFLGQGLSFGSGEPVEVGHMRAPVTTGDSAAVTHECPIVKLNRCLCVVPGGSVRPDDRVPFIGPAATHVQPVVFKLQLPLDKRIRSVELSIALGHGTVDTSRACRCKKSYRQVRPW